MLKDSFILEPTKRLKTSSTGNTGHLMALNQSVLHSIRITPNRRDLCPEGVINVTFLTDSKSQKNSPTLSPTCCCHGKCGLFSYTTFSIQIISLSFFFFLFMPFFHPLKYTSDTDESNQALGIHRESYLAIQ